MTSGPSAYSAQFPSGSTGPDTLDSAYDITGFTPGQIWYKGFSYKAVRSTGTNVDTLTDKVRWWDASGTELTATQNAIPLNGNTLAPASGASGAAGWQWYEASHMAPPNAVRGRINFTVTPPTGQTTQHDVYITSIRMAKTPNAGVSGSPTANNGGGGTNLFSDPSFELGVPAVTAYPDGGGLGLSVVTTAPILDGTQCLGMAFGGGAQFYFNQQFTIKSTTAVISFYMRDAGVTNTTRTGTNYGGPAGQCLTFNIGLVDRTANPFPEQAYLAATPHAVPYAGSGSQIFQQPFGQGWTRYSMVVSGLTPGNSYSVSAQGNSSFGNECFDIDMVQVEEGTIATAFTSVSDAVLYKALSDDVLDRQEKHTTLQSLVSDLEARYQLLLTRAQTLNLSTTALTTARTNWLNLLTGYSPGYNDYSTNTLLYAPWFQPKGFPKLWTANGGLTQSSSQGYTVLQDASATATGYFSRSQNTIPAASYYFAFGVTVQKGTSTVASRIELAFTGGTAFTAGFNFRLSDGGTGGASANLTIGGVMDLGTDWFVWGWTQSTPTGTSYNTTCQFNIYPAYSSTLTATAPDMAQTNTLNVRNAKIIFNSNAGSGLGREYMVGTCNAYIAQMTSQQTSISNIDSQISNRPDGVSAGNVYYDNTGTVFQKADTLNWYLRTGVSGAVVQTGVTMTWQVMAGDLNGKTASSGAQALTLSSGVGTVSPTSMNASSTQLKIVMTYNGLTYTYYCTLTKQLAAPPAAGGSTGSGGGSASSSDVVSQSSGFNSFSTTTQVVVTSGLTFTLPSGKSSFTVTFNFSADPGANSPQGSWTPYCLIQYSANGGSTWTQIGATITGGSDAQRDADTLQWYSDAASFIGPRQATGLPTTGGTQYQVRAIMYLATGVRLHTVTGTISIATP